MMQPPKMVIVGAGPVGALAALYAAQRGYCVEVYEQRPDLRDPNSSLLSPGKSINLALSERGLNALRHAGQPELLRRIVDASVPMRGRMIHGKSASGRLFELPQDYDALGRTNLAIDQGALTAALLDSLDELPHVKLFFHYKFISADFHGGTALVEDGDWLSHTTKVKFDILIGADGAHSAVRCHMMKLSRMSYQHEYIDMLWCEFRMRPRKARGDGACMWKISPDYLHTWPAGDSMFIAIPNKDGSFTCTLFMPRGRFAALEADKSEVPQFFDKNFPGVRDHISDMSLTRSFSEGPHQSLISIKCKPYHVGSSGVIVGDAAHAMAPFYGQGMNAGMEDIRVLFSTLDKHAQAAKAAVGEGSGSYAEAAEARRQALAEYSANRWRDAHAIHDLAMQNYLGMQTSRSVVYRLRKALEEFMHVRFPTFGWRTRYSRVVFSNEPYAECKRRSDRQGHLLSIFTALFTCPFVAVGLYFVFISRSPAPELFGASKAPWRLPGF